MFRIRAADALGSLLLTSFGIALSCLYLFDLLPSSGGERAMLAVLLFTMAGVAFSDLVTGVLRVEGDQRFGMTGGFHSIESAATIGRQVERDAATETIGLGRTGLGQFCVKTRGQSRV